MRNVGARLTHRTSKADGKKMWYAVFTDPDRRPERKTVTLRTKSKAVARQKLAAMEREVALGVYDPWEQRRADGVAATRAAREFGEAIGKLADRGEVSRNHARACAQVAALFAAGLPEGTRTDRVKPSDVDAFVWPHDNANTRLQYHARLKRFFRWCARRGYVKRSPVADAKKPGTPPRRPPRYLTRPEVERVVAAAVEVRAEVEAKGGPADASAWWAALFWFAVGSGLRLGEVRSLRWQDVEMPQDGRPGLIRVQASGLGSPGPLDGLEGPDGVVTEGPPWPGFKPKWEKARTVPMLPDALRALTPESEGGLYPYEGAHVFAERAPHRLVWPSPHAFHGMSHGRARSGMLNGGSISRAWRVCRERSGVGDDAMTFHSTRHTFASWLAQSGLPLQHLQKVLGHRNLTTTQIYAHVSEESVTRSMMEAAERIR